jgi:hypothetical protein
MHSDVYNSTAYTLLCLTLVADPGCCVFLALKESAPCGYRSLYRRIPGFGGNAITILIACDFNDDYTLTIIAKAVCLDSARR